MYQRIHAEIIIYSRSSKWSLQLRSCRVKDIFYFNIQHLFHIWMTVVTNEARKQFSIKRYCFARIVTHFVSTYTCLTIWEFDNCHEMFYYGGFNQTLCNLVTGCKKTQKVIGVLYSVDKQKHRSDCHIILLKKIPCALAHYGYCF